jgi:uncharacterized damage-inducible protein DinB
MNTVAYLRQLFAHDDWANREVLNGLKDTKNAPKRCLELLAHILSAERLWLERIEAKKQSLPVWPDFTLEECAAQMADMAEQWKRLLAEINEGNIERTIAYSNSKGEPWNSQVRDVLMHVVMHSAYHRGQIAADMRAAGLVPAYTDFIHAVRQGLLE